MVDANVYFMCCLRVEIHRSLCPLDFAQKCCQNAGIMPFQRPKFQNFPGGMPPDPLDGRALRRVYTPRPSNVHILPKTKLLFD